jgi:hypothetical protein
MFFYLLCSVRHVPSMHHSSSVHFSCCTLPHSTHLNHSQKHPISSLFCIFILCVHLLHPLFTMLLHALPMSSALPDHHCNSSASLAVKPMRPSSLGVMPRFLSLSNSRDSSVFSVTVELIPSIAVPGSNCLTFVNSLYEQSSCHWKMPRDSSSSLVITLKSLRVL